MTRARVPPVPTSIPRKYIVALPGSFSLYTIGQVRCMSRIGIVNLIVNFKIVYCLRARHDTPEPIQQGLHGAPSQERGFAQIVGQREGELCFQTRLTAGKAFLRLGLRRPE